MLKIVGFSVIVSLLYVLLSQHKKEYAVLLQLCAVVIILIIILPDIKLLIDSFQSYLDLTSLNTNYLSLIVKALGVSIVTQFAHDTCIDCGESALASKVEFAGKTVILSLSLPMLKAIAEFTLELIGN